MILVSLLLGLFVFLAFILSIFVLLQQGKGDMGLGGLGRGSQTLFGGSGGQTFFEKATWVLGFCFMLGSLLLVVMKMKELETSRVHNVKRDVAPVSAPIKN